MSKFEEKYRKRTPGAEPGSAAAPAIEVLKAAASTDDDDKEYKAYNVVAHPEFELWVRPNAANENGDTSLPYGRRSHMITDGNGFVISQHYDTAIISVKLQGRNLQDLFRKLLKHEVEWVMEFDPRKWATPPDGEPCITGIEITRKPLPEKRDDDTLPGERRPSGKAAPH